MFKSTVKLLLEFLALAALVLAIIDPAAAQTTQSVTYTVTFQDNSDASATESSETGFRIERARQQPCETTPAAWSVVETLPAKAGKGLVTTKHTIVGDPGNITYCFRAIAFNSAGVSGYSNIAKVITPQIIVIVNAPSGIQATIVGVTVP